MTLPLRSSNPSTSGLRAVLASAWLSLVFLIPVLFIAVLGIRGIRANRQITLENARADSVEAIEFFAAQPLGGSRQLYLYPLVPEPALPSQLDELLSRGPDASPNEASMLLSELEKYRGKTTSAGLPASPLIDWIALRAVRTPSEFSSRLERLSRESVEIYPSIITAELLQRSIALAGERGVPFPSASDWQEKWKQDESVRSLIRQIQKEEETEQINPGWRSDGAGRWWITSTMEPPFIANPRLAFYVTRHEDMIQEAKKLLEKRPALLPGFISISIVAEGVELIPAPPNGTILAQRSPRGVEVTAWLVDPDTLFRQERMETLWFTGLLAAALLAVLSGFIAMQRALISERVLNNQKSDFVSSVSHELRAPVASMGLLLENLESGAVIQESTRRDYVRLLSSECRRLGTLIENVLDFARIEHGRKVYHFDEADIPAMVRDAVQILQPRATSRRQEIRVELTPIDPIPKIDALAIQQAVINLVDNAIKFSPEGTCITVSVGPLDGRTWQISVADQGPGIPESERQRIFERFYRIGSELRRETQGSGIGLALVKHTVEAHGGRIEVESQPGAGAKFTIILLNA